MTTTHYTHHGPVEALAPEPKLQTPTPDPLGIEVLLDRIRPTRAEWCAVLEAVAMREDRAVPLAHVERSVEADSERVVALARLMRRVRNPVGPKEICARESCEVRFLPTAHQRYCSSRCKKKVAESNRA